MISRKVYLFLWVSFHSVDFNLIATRLPPLMKYPEMYGLRTNVAQLSFSEKNTVLSDDTGTRRIRCRTADADFPDDEKGLIMKRFRVYDCMLQETLEQEDDYGFRDKENYYICDLIDALQNRLRFTVQENTGILDIFNRYIFEGDKVSFNEEVCGHTLVRTGIVAKSETGMWLLMVDETIPFGLYHVKCRVILGNVN